MTSDPTRWGQLATNNRRVRVVLFFYVEYFSLVRLPFVFRILISFSGSWYNGNVKRCVQKQKISPLRRRNSGFSVVEVMLGAAIFVVFSSGVIALVLQGLETDRLAEEEAIASHYASEGIEALRSLRNQSFSNLVPTGSAGIDRVGAGGVWAFAGASTSYGKYVRTVSVADVLRDASGNIVPSGGTLDPLSRKVTSTVVWPVTSARTNTISFASYLTDWKKPLLSRRGMLVYGDGGDDDGCDSLSIARRRAWYLERSGARCRRGWRVDQ